MSLIQTSSLYLQSFTDGAVAQSVEQRTENPCVAGSIPAHTTIKKNFYNCRGSFFCAYILYELPLELFSDLNKQEPSTNNQS